MAGAAPAVAAFDPDAGPFVTATPDTITPEALADTGVRIQGQTFNTGGPLQNQIVTVTAPSGLTETRNQRTTDGTFDITFIPTGPTEVGTYSVRSAGFAGQPSLSVANTTFQVTAVPEEPEAPPASVMVDPTVISPDAFLEDGVRATGRTFDNGGPINRSDLELTSPSGATADYFDLTGDGTFSVTIRPKDDVLTTPLETGTWTLTATSLLRPEFTATTTFEVAGDESPPPASISVTPRTITGVDFAADGVQASGRTFDSGSEVGIERSDLVLTAPSGATAEYFDLTSDGTFNVNIQPKGDVASNPVETGTYTLQATSPQDPSFTASTTFQVIAPAAPPVDRDPEANATPESLTQSEFLAGGVNLTGFTEDTPGPRTRQRIQVTTPGGDVIECADFTGDGTYDIQVYPSDAPDEGPDGQRVCDLSTGGLALPGSPVTPADLMPVPVGTYEVVSFGFIREDARATTSFEVVADPVTPVPPGEDDNDDDQGNDDQGDVDQNVGGSNGNGDNVADNAGNGILPDAGGASLLMLLAGLALLGAGGVVVAARRTAHGRHLG
ncbi:hypothetical protein [Aeromicrobium sp. CF3.5]|uniref:hypothetical protein n=1 Tax=Aeromicrobium sp. CF3.5 TaxID=3373078 RepID=UPI003EE4D886